MESVYSFLKRFDSAALRLVGVGLASLSIYLLAFVVPASLFKLYDQPQLDRIFLYAQGRPGYLHLLLAFASLAVFYWLAYRIVSQSAQEESLWFIVLGGTLLFGIVFLFMAPFDAADIYDNILHGRILGVYGANPFIRVIADYPRDPFFAYAGWPNTPSAYGPFWEMLAGLVARLAGNSIIVNVLAFKLLPGLFHLAGVGIIILILRRYSPSKALSGALLLGWNPVVLYETWGNGHNDMAMTFWLLVAAWWLYRRHYSLAIFSLVVGAMFKFIPLLLIPVILVIGWRNLPGVRTRLGFITQSAIGSCFIILLGYYRFWNGFGSLNITWRAELFTTSIPSVINKALAPILGVQAAGRWISVSALVVLLAFLVYQSSRSGGDPLKDYIQAAFNVFTFYLMLVCLWFLHWYGLWLFALTPLMSERNRNFALFLGFWVLTQQLIFGPWLVPKILAAQSTQAVRLEALLTLGVWGAPWAYALRNLWMRKQTMKEEKHEIRNGRFNRRGETTRA